MKAIENLLDMPVVTVREGRRVGTLEGVEIDAGEARIEYLRLRRDGRSGPANVPWSAVQSIGHDVVLISSEAALVQEVPPSQRSSLTPRVGDRPVVTESGDKLGRVSGFDVDETTGEVTRYRVGGWLARLRGTTLVVPPTSIRTFGRDAIIVDDSTAADSREPSTGHPERSSTAAPPRAPGPSRSQQL